MPNSTDFFRQMSACEVEKCFRWFTNQSSEIRITILQRFENNRAQKCCSQSQGQEDLARTIYQVRNEIRMTTRRKNPNHDLEPLLEIHKKRFAMIHQNSKKKSKPTFQAIKRYFNTITEFRQKPFVFNIPPYCLFQSCVKIIMGFPAHFFQFAAIKGIPEIMAFSIFHVLD